MIQDNERTYKTYEEIIRDRCRLEQIASFIVCGSPLGENYECKDSLDVIEENAYSKLEEELKKHIVDEDIFSKVMNAINSCVGELQNVNVMLGMKGLYTFLLDLTKKK